MINFVDASVREGRRHHIRANLQQPSSFESLASDIKHVQVMCSRSRVRECRVASSRLQDSAVPVHSIRRVQL